MPIVPITDVGRVGIIEDIPPYNLPPNAWSGGNNVRFLDNGVKKVAGYDEVMATCPFAPYYVQSYLDASGTYYWLAYGATDIAVWNGSTWTDVTRQTVMTLNGSVSASGGSITVNTGAALTALAPSSSGTLLIGNEDTGSSNIYEEVTYASFNTGTGVITLTGTLANNHPSGAIVTPSGTTSTVDSDYGATATERKWTVTNLNGIIVATNGYDTPQFWPLSSGIPALTTPFRELRNWPLVAKSDVIRSFRTFLVGLNWDRTNPEPRLVKWSTEASYGQPPVTWSETDNTLDSGEYQLADTPGVIVDGLPLGDSFMIYKEDSIYIMNYVGTPYIFSFKLLSPNIGCISKNCVAEFEGGHFFIGVSDFYLCNGQQVTPLLPEKLRRAVFDDLDGDSKNYNRCFVAADYVRNEMIAAYPSTSGAAGGPANKAIIWNWKTNTFGMRDLPTTSHITSGIVEITAGTTWNNIVGNWNGGSGSWGSTNYANVSENLVFADITNTKLFRDNHGNTKDGTNMTSYIERTGYDLGDPSMIKYVSAVYPELEVSGDNVIKVYVGHQMATERAITWDNGTDFNPNTQSKVSCRATGKYFAVKFESSGDFDWKLNGLAFDVKPRGKRGGRSYP
tara:strand:- start:455 stop:2314 length:1860 start_codon:yes stop_codon:yes gene_type:complete